MTTPKEWNTNQTPNIPNLGQERVIWKNDVMNGIIHRKVVEAQVITNFRVMQNNRSISLSELDDILVMDQHRESQYQGQRYYIRGARVSYGTGRSTGKTVGNIAFIYQGQPAIVFGNIQDPSGVVRLAKAARKSMIQQMKAAEKLEAKMKKEKERELKSYSGTKSKQNKNEIISSSGSDKKICNKCGNSNPGNSNFCVKCGAVLTSACSKCGGNNPSGSAFCNNCGFALA